MITSCQTCSVLLASARDVVVDAAAKILLRSGDFSWLLFLVDFVMAETGLAETRLAETGLTSGSDLMPLQRSMSGVAV